MYIPCACIYSVCVISCLCPCRVGGVQGGKIINQLQTATGTRVKLSQKNEFFPGTHDRVALVQGEDPNMVAEAVAEMLRRLREVKRNFSIFMPRVAVVVSALQMRVFSCWREITPSMKPREKRAKRRLFSPFFLTCPFGSWQTFSKPRKKKMLYKIDRSCSPLLYCIICLFSCLLPPLSGPFSFLCSPSLFSRIISTFVGHSARATPLTAAPLAHTNANERTKFACMVACNVRVCACWRSSCRR